MIVMVVIVVGLLMEVGDGSDCGGSCDCDECCCGGTVSVQVVGAGDGIVVVVVVASQSGSMNALDGGRW